MSGARFLFTSAGFLFASAVGVVVLEPSDRWIAGIIAFSASVCVGAGIAEIVNHTHHNRHQ